jgi:hypothetical protein
MNKQNIFEGADKFNFFSAALEKHIGARKWTNRKQEFSQ